MAGYSGTPLPQKLGIKENHRVAIFGAPKTFAKTLGALPTGATVTDVVIATKSAPKQTFDVFVVFVTKKKDLAAAVEKHRKFMEPAAGLWIAWPKKSSGVATDITEQTIRDIALPTGLVDNKVCAIDDTWSGLRLVIRKELRP